MRNILKILIVKANEDFSEYEDKPIYFSPEERKTPKLSDLTKIPKLVSGTDTVGYRNVKC